MNKRQRSGGRDIDVLPPAKQVRLTKDDEEDQQETPTNGKGSSQADESIPDIPAMETQQQLNLNDSKQRKPRETGTIGQKGGRRRMSGTQRWGGGAFPHGGNMRDPLNLKSVKPEEPNRPNGLPVSASGIGSDEQNKRKPHWTEKKPVDKDSSQFASPTATRKPFIPPNQRKTRPSLDQRKEGQSEEKPGEAKAKEQAKQLSDEVDKAASEKDAEARNERKRKMAERYRYGNFNDYHLKQKTSSQWRGNPPGAAAPFGGDGPGPHHRHVFDQQLGVDPRVDLFCPDWFVDAQCLDIGANAGRFTISLARRFQPRRVVGVELDQHLVGAARKNIRHFTDKDTKLTSKFPASFESNFGPISAPSTSSGPHFPDNIWFFCENYVLPSDADLDKVTEQYDIIFALAVTKWVHLNWGDPGMRRFFQRVFRQLKTGGRFILETAPFKDYKKHCSKKGAEAPPEEVLRHFQQISFLPEQFTDFLLNTVGFSHHEELNTPQAKYLGITGRLQVFYKGKFMLTEDGKTPNRGEQPSSTQTQQEEAGRTPTVPLPVEEEEEALDFCIEQLPPIPQNDDHLQFCPETP